MDATAPHPYRLFEPLFGNRHADAMVDLCERFGSYGMYSEESLNEGIGEGLPQRFDSAFNYIQTGGRFGRKEELQQLAARTNYFRETFAYGDEIAAPGIEPFLRHEGFVEAARALFGRPVIEPAIVFANLLLPGQELATHTDVPEFRGANRKRHPQWLLVVMHHSGLFESWRMPIATGVAWFHDGRGGAFAFYPDGPKAPPTVHDVHFDTAVLTDTDTVFHGVDQVSLDGPLPPYRPGMRLEAQGGGRWAVSGNGERIADLRWPEMRFSISWKAYCFRDEAERKAWFQHSDDLSIEFVLDTLERDLRERGRLEGERPANRNFAMQLVQEYIEFPSPASSASASD